MNAVRRALGAAVVGLGVGAGLLLAGAPAHARTSTAPPATPAAPSSAPTTVPTTVPDDAETRAVFTGSFVRLPQVTVVGQAQVRRYQVQVSQVFGPTQITTQRVTVRTRADLERCGTRRGGQGTGQSGTQQEQAGGSSATPSATPTTTPPSTTAPPSTSVDKRPRLFDALVDGNEYVVAGCAAAPLATDTTIAGVEDKLGDGRPPGAVETPGAQLDDVGLLCPDTRDPIRLDDQGSCDSLDPGTSFSRNAAPGLAIVIVGGLGLLLVRRLGRSRG